MKTGHIIRLYDKSPAALEHRALRDAISAAQAAGQLTWIEDSAGMPVAAIVPPGVAEAGTPADRARTALAGDRNLLDELRQAAADEPCQAAFTALAEVARTLGVYHETTACESIEDVGVLLANTISTRWQRTPQNARPGQ